MVGETNSMVGYHLIAKGYIQISWDLGDAVSSPAGPGQHPDNSNNININKNIFGVSYKIKIKS